MKPAYLVVPLLAIFSLILSAAPTIPDQVQKWPQGRRITVALKTGDKVVGRLGPLEKEGFSLISEKRDHPELNLRYDEVQDVGTKMTTATKWKIGAIIYIPLLVMSLVLGK